MRRTGSRRGRCCARLSPDEIHQIVRRRARQAGITDREKVGAHSLRATGATLAAGQDVPAGVIAEHGYTRTANLWKDNAMRGTGF